MKNKRNFRQDMDQALSGLTLGEKKEEILKKAFSSLKKQRGRMVRRLAVACLAVCALTAAAFALSPGLRQILNQHLGGWQEESQQFSGLETEDNGISVRAVSALSDDGFTRIYLEIQDKTGDRLGRIPVWGPMEVTGIWNCLPRRWLPWVRNVWVTTRKAAPPW